MKKRGARLLSSPKKVVENFQFLMLKKKKIDAMIEPKFLKKGYIDDIFKAKELISKIKIIFASYRTLMFSNLLEKKKQKIYLSHWQVTKNLCHLWI